MGNYNFGGTGENNVWFDSFEDDAIGSEPVGLIKQSSANQGSTVSVVSSYAGHQKVVKATPTSGKWCDASIPIGENVQGTSVTFSGWFNTVSTTDWYIFACPGQGPQNLNNDNQYIFRCGVNGGILKLTDVKLWQTLIACTYGVWYHWSVVANFVTQTYDFYLNGALMVSGYDFANTLTYVDHFSYTGYNSPAGLYYDAWNVQNYTRYENAWDCLNVSQSFQLVGSYTYQFQLWNAGTRYDCPSIAFVVGQAPPNSQLISGAQIATKWQFTSLATTPTWATDYLSDFSTETYTLIPSSGNSEWFSGYGSAVYTSDFSSDVWTGGTTFDKTTTIANDAFVNEAAATTNYGSNTKLYLKFLGSPDVMYSYLCWNDASGYIRGDTLQQYLNLYSQTADWARAHKTTQFNEASITWNTKGADGGSVWSGYLSFPGWQEINIGTSVTNNAVYLNTEITETTYFDSSETANQPYVRQQFEEVLRTTGILYLQSGSTKSITASSPVFSDISLRQGSYISIAYSSGASNLQISFLDGGINQGTFTLSATVSITSDITFDQIQISGDFDDKEIVTISGLQIIPAIYTQKLVQSASAILIQTNVLETLTLRSPNTFSLQMATNYRITLDFIHTTTKEVKLNLKLAGVIKQTYTIIEEGGVEHKILTGIGSCNFDQFEITGNFNAQNFQLNSILIESATYTSPIFTFYLNPFGNLPVSIPIDLYQLDITPYPSTGETLYSENQEIEAYQQNVIIYTPFSGQERQIMLFDNKSKIVSFENFRVIVNRTLNGQSGPVNINPPHYLLSNRFWADDLSYYNCSIWDRFGNLLYNVTNEAITTFIDIQLAIFSVKFQNLMKTPTELSINNTLNEIIVKGEIIETYLCAGNYSIAYQQSELQVPISAQLIISGPTLYIFNSSYRSIWFSQFGPDLFSLGNEGCRLYVNSTRYQWETPVELLGDWFNVTALDYFGDVQYSGIVNLANSTEFNIPILYADVNIANNYNFTCYCHIEKNGILLINVMLQANWTTQFRFSIGTYDISFYDAVGNHLTDAYTHDLSFTLAANDTQLVAFGFTKFDVPVSFKTDMRDWLLFVVVILCIAIGIVFLVAAKTKVELKRERSGKTKRAFSDNRVS